MKTNVLSHSKDPREVKLNNQNYFLILFGKYISVLQNIVVSIKNFRLLFILQSSYNSDTLVMTIISVKGKGLWI